MAHTECYASFHLGSNKLNGKITYKPGVSVSSFMARRACQEESKILIPVKSDATLSALKQQISKCFNDVVLPVHVGLEQENELEEENESFVFSDGVIYTDEEHGHLFGNNEKPRPGQQCVDIVFDRSSGRLKTLPCTSGAVLCYEPLNQRTTSPATWVGVIFGLLFILFAGVGVYVVYNKRKSEIREASNNQNSVKSVSGLVRLSTAVVDPLPSDEPSVLSLSSLTPAVPRSITPPKPAKRSCAAQGINNQPAPTAAVRSLRVPQPQPRSSVIKRAPEVSNSHEMEKIGALHSVRAARLNKMEPPKPGRHDDTVWT